MFLDQVVIEVASGTGGRGSVSFRREKYVPQGGPDGGDGGRGGDVVLVVDPELNTLGDFRQRRRFTARDGTAGSKQLRTGAAGEDLVLLLPPGTVVTDAETGEVIADLDQPAATLVVCRGGRGGRGNARFASSTRQAPRVGELGAQGRQRRLNLELKLIADVGLVGLPNAGKSTLLAALTGAHPKIADYPFTTLTPNLGVAEDEHGFTLVFADVPGLIEGAHLGVGLGHDFLRHLERTRVLVHVIDCALGADQAMESLLQVSDELRRFSDELAAKPQVIALNKIDIEAARRVAMELQPVLDDAFMVAAATAEGCEELRGAVAALVETQRAGSRQGRPASPVPGQETTHRLYRHEPREHAVPVVTREGEGYRVASAAVERLVSMTDLDSDEAVTMLQTRMRRAGVDTVLAAAGCREGDTVHIGTAEFEWHEG